MKFYLISKKFSALFSYVTFLNLSTHSIREFNKNFDINDLNTFIWVNICNRFEQGVSSDSKDEYQQLNKNRYIAN